MTEARAKSRKKTTKRRSKKTARRRTRRKRGARSSRKPKNLKRPKAKKRIVLPRRVGIGVTIAAGLVLAVAVGANSLYHWFAGRAGPKLPQPVEVAWPDGLSAGDSAKLLQDLGLIDYPTLMTLFMKMNGAPECLKTGPHLLSGGATPGQLLAMVCRRPSRPAMTVVIPEGFNRFEIAKRLRERGVVSAEAFLHATRDQELLHSLGVELGEGNRAATAEGLLFPATYRFRFDSEPRELVRLMVRQVARRFDALAKKFPEGVAALKNDHQWGRREILTLASIVEKEAAVAEERPIIASVFLNRLASTDLNRLQSDPTAMYGCLVLGDSVPACVGFNGRASGAINRDKENTYSTYLVEGLPPGPICNPGEASIRAVLAPADTEYLYFVVKGQGRHTFSVDYAAHLEAVKKLRRR